MIEQARETRRPFRTLENQLRDFHHDANQSIGTSPQIRDADLRARLILEEAIETALALLMNDFESGVEAGLRVHDILDGVMKNCVAMGKLNRNPDAVGRLVEAIDGMCDLAYVTIGTAVACGTPLDPFWNEVHRSNMQKAGAPIVNGKLMKPRGWRPPQLREIFESLRPSISDELKEWKSTSRRAR